MSASRYALGLAVLVTVVLVLGSLGLVAASTGTPAPSHAASPASASATPSLPNKAPASTQAELTATSTSVPSSSYPSPAAPTTPSAIPTPSGRMSSTVAELNKLHVPLKYAFLPNLNANPDPTLVNGHITPGYQTAPAPLGVAEYGLRNVSGTITPYTLSTPSVEGTYAPYDVHGLSQDISGPDEYGVQLNSVLNNVTLQGTTGYEFWTQNVVEYSVNSNQLFFVSNIWNFSGGPLTQNDFYQIGPNATVAAPEYYYGLGGPITVSYPFTLDLYLNSTLIDGRDAVFFNFSLTSDTGFWAGSYDYAIFNSTVAGGPAAQPPVYIASGSVYNPIGLPNDFEMVMGGPGGGSNFDIFSSYAYFGLQYWNSTTGSYQTVPSAYGWGSETGETSTGGYMLWGTPAPYPFAPVAGNPSAFMTTGPSILNQLWNVSSAAPNLYTYGGYLDLTVTPANAFVFIAPGDVFTGWYTTDWSLFQWAPYSVAGSDFELDPGAYTVIVVMADHDPAEFEVTVPAAGSSVSQSVSLGYDYAQGVYTPLWAFNNTDLGNISNNIGGFDYIFNNQYGMLGYAAYSGVQFPWFGAANDYLFPVFPGLLLYNTTAGAYFYNPPSFQTNYPEPLYAELVLSGLPGSNDLQMMVWNSSEVYLVNGADIGGWWYAGAYFGPAASAYNVVFWNVTDSVITGNTFDTSGNALYLYGGTYNAIYNNTFEQTIPLVPNPGATVAAAYGSMGLFDADYGNATDVAASFGEPSEGGLCFFGYGYCDLIFNNIFLTDHTAASPLYDPYYFYLAYPTCPAYLGFGPSYCYFDNAWNLFPDFVPWPVNIIGGLGIGGNYWWNYGSFENPYTYLPYAAYDYYVDTDIFWGGDYLPLTPYPLYNVQFVETGLPSGVYWEAGIDIDGDTYYVTSNTNSLNLTVPAGEYDYYLYSYLAWWAAPNGVVDVDGNTVVDVVFSSAYQVTFTQSGLAAGTWWYIEVFNATNDQFLGFGESNTPWLNWTGILPAQYLWDASSSSDWFAPTPAGGTVDVTGNVSVGVHFVPVYAFTVQESGLPAGTAWQLLVWNSTETYAYLVTSTNATVYVLPGAFNYLAVASGYVANPNQGTASVTGNTTVTVKFAVAATLTFTEGGLTSGAAWTVSLDQGGAWTNLTSTGTSIVFNAIAGAYTYSVYAAGYAASPASGSGTLPANTPVAVTFTAGVPNAGTLSVSVTTSGASATVNGAAVTLPFSGSEAPGLYAIVVSAPGYVTYYNNVSVVSGQTTHVAVTLVAVGSGSGTSTSTSGIGSTGWLLIGVLAALAVIFLITTLVFARRGRPPAPMQSPPPMAGGSAPPAGGTGAPAWSEGPNNPPPGAA